MSRGFGDGSRSAFNARPVPVNMIESALRVGGLPQNLSRRGIERRPRSARGALARDQPVGNVILVADRDVDARAVERRAPFHAALIGTRTDERVPEKSSGVRFKK